MRNLIAYCFFCFIYDSVYSQTSTDILLFNLKWSGSELTITKGENITHRKGYDNQPYFHSQMSTLYFSSFNDSGRSDIKVYNIKKRITTQFTNTNEREYSPTVVPGGKFISCIIQRDNGAQDLGIYPIRGGEVMTLISHLIVGYHCWITNDKLLLFVLEKNEGSSLRLYTLSTKKDTIIATNIGRSLHQIPGTNSMSFVQKNDNGNNVVKSIDRSTLQITDLTETLPGQDHLCWLNDQVILMSDGGSKIFWKSVSKKTIWKEAKIDDSMNEVLKGISRLATNSMNNKLAIVVNE